MSYCPDWVHHKKARLDIFKMFGRVFCGLFMNQSKMKHFLGQNALKFCEIESFCR